MAAYSSVPAGHESADSLEAGLLSTGDEDKIHRFAPPSSTPPPPPPPPRSMSPLRKLSLAVLLGMFLGLGLSLAKDYTTRPCLSGAASIVVVEQSPDSTHALGRLLHSWIPDRLVNNLAASPPAFAGLAKRQDDTTGGGNATSRATSSFQPQTSTTALSSTVESSSSSLETSSPPTTTDSSVAPVTSSLDSSCFKLVKLGTDLVPVDPGGYDDFFHASTSTNNFRVSHNIVVSDLGGIVFYNSRYVYDGRATSINVFIRQCANLLVLVSSFHVLVFHVAEDSSSPETTEANRRTITTGKVSTSSAVRTTWTTTLDNGGITTLTSTSWVAVVPSETAATKSGREADLQNAASQMHVGATLFAMVAALTVGVMLA
ncbi:hypothetical protein CP532_3781 [Ophiocordyceps camponoti-leonardi (nom. inval.)]|nr:hypothetical protein CP532_3781 [Ophiocordyceps camponoti-leonardi (nom. inval.)]